MCSALRSSDYQHLLGLGEALQSSLKLEEALDAAVPVLCEMTASDHVALAISRPGTMYDYEWHNTSLPEAFLGNYLSFAEHDFVRKAVSSAPNKVFRDQEMISRAALERHVVYRSALDAGARLERVMAVMLSQEQDWSSGLSLYRSTAKVYDSRDAKLLQLAVPMIKATVQNSRRFSEAHRLALSAATATAADLPILWLEIGGREIGRTESASSVLERFFTREERTGGLPGALLLPLQRYAASSAPHAVVDEFVRARDVNCLRVRYARVQDPSSGQPLWALLLDVRGVPFELEARLSRRQCEVLGLVMRGYTAGQIAALQDRALSTIKQQTNEAYKILGVSKRGGLLSLVAGFVDDAGR